MYKKYVSVAASKGIFFKNILFIKTKDSDLRGIVFEKTKKINI